MKNNIIKNMYGVFILVFLWQVISWANVFNPIYFASPLEVLKESVLMFKNGDIFLDLLLTVKRIVVAIIIASVIGVPVGIIFGYFKNIYKIFGKIIDFFRAIPPIIFYPLFLIALGTGDASRISVAFIGGVVVVILIISKGLFQQSSLRRNYVKILGANSWQVLRDVIWYESLPHIFTALRTASSLIVIIVIVTEMLVGARYGLGTRVQSVQITSNIPDLFATTIIIGFLGLLLNIIFIFLEKKFVYWKFH